jgi:hypothetical protein
VVIDAVGNHMVDAAVDSVNCDGVIPRAHLLPVRSAHQIQLSEFRFRGARKKRQNGLCKRAGDQFALARGHADDVGVPFHKQAQTGAFVAAFGEKANLLLLLLLSC